MSVWLIDGLSEQFDWLNEWIINFIFRNAYLSLKCYYNYLRLLVFYLLLSFNLKTPSPILLAERDVMFEHGQWELPVLRELSLLRHVQWEILLRARMPSQPAVWYVPGTLWLRLQHLSGRLHDSQHAKDHNCELEADKGGGWNKWREMKIIIIEDLVSKKELDANQAVIICLPTFPLPGRKHNL